MADIFGTALNDVLLGTFGDDLLRGFEGNDSLEGGDGNDTLDGGSGNDTLIGDAGSDSLFGGEGDDRITGAGGINLLDGGDGDDALFSSSAGDTLVGGTGRDTLDLSRQASTINFTLRISDFFPDAATVLSDGTSVSGFEAFFVRLGTGNDTLTLDRELLTTNNEFFGGAGNDTLILNYASSTGGLNFTSRNGGRPLLRGGFSWFAFVEGFETYRITGSSGDDVFDGGEGSDEINGGLGRDALTAGSGADTLRGEAGNDSLSDNDNGPSSFENTDVLDGGEGNDFIQSGGGTNVVLGGAGNDFIRSGLDQRFAALSSVDTIDGGDGVDTLELSVALATNAISFDLVQITSASGLVLSNGTTIRNVELFSSVTGGAGNDTFTVITSILTSGTRINGGNGNDRLIGDFSSATTDISNSNGTIQVGEVSLIASVESAQLTGGSGNDALRGYIGNDQISGGIGNDTITGNDGNDTLDGGLGVDVLDGQAGFDFASYANATSGLILFMGGANFNTAEANGDTHTSIEGLIGSEFSDIIGADANNNELRGLDGNDFIYGRGGIDTLLGGDGNDVLSGGLDADVLTGGTGLDVAYFRDATTSVTASLLSGGTVGEAAGDTYVEIENIWGSNFDDVLAGDNNAGQVYGFAGNDNLSGLGGDDFFYGGTGSDTITGGDGVDSAFYLSWDDHVNQFGTPEPYEGGDTFTDFVSGTDRVILSRFWFGFGNIGGPAAALTETHANFVTNGNVATGRPSLIWNNDARTLSFDADGNGATQAVLLGTFQGSSTLALSDIWTA